MKTVRRRFLRFCGVAGIGAIAGCSSESDDPEMPTKIATHAGAPPETNSIVEGRTKIAPSDGDAEDRFGTSLAVSSDGTTAIVGASDDEDPNGADDRDGAGSVYVFEAVDGSWSQQAKLAPADGDGGDSFGYAVDLSSDGTTAIVGAVGDEDPNGRNGGAAYVFDGTGDSWSQQTKLSGDGSGEGASFGNSVALSSDGTTAIVGAVNDDNINGDLAGAVYVFDSGDSWDQQAKLAPDDGDSYDQFGGAVTVSDDGRTVLVGADQDEDPTGGAKKYGPGAAYVFEIADGSWSQQAKLAADDGGEDDSFGAAVVLSGDGTTAIVGDPRTEGSDGHLAAGAAYVFDSASESWSQQAKLTASDGDWSHLFGVSAALASDGTCALIGSYGADASGGPDTGVAYVFETDGDGWRQQSRVTDDGGTAGDQFGYAVALSSEATTAFVSAAGDAEGRGSAHVLYL